MNTDNQKILGQRRTRIMESIRKNRKNYTSEIWLIQQKVCKTNITMHRNNRHERGETKEEKSKHQPDYKLLGQ